MAMQIYPDPEKVDSQKRHRKTDPFLKNTWVLLIIAWVIYLVPISGTSYIASILVLGALVMTIVALAHGKTQQGIVQLLSLFIISPIFFLLGLIIFQASVNKTIDLDSLSSQQLKDVIIRSYNQEIEKYSGIIHDKFEYKKQNKEQEIVHIKYIVYLKSGGILECSDVQKQDNSIKIKNKTGLIMDINLPQIEKIDKFETKNNKTNITSWHPIKVN
jgi:hypothetical protein